jgi:beta-glucosidase
MQAAAARRMGSDRFEPYLTVMDSDQYLQPLIAAHDAGFAAIKAARSDLPVGVTLAVVDFQASEPGTRIDEIRYDTYAAWMEAARRNCDFVGVQNYNREVIGPNGTVTPAKEAEKDFLGREVYPEALGNAVRYIHEGTGKPILITENGIVTNDDTQRVRYIDGAIASMRRVMTEGVPVLGYIHWSLLDNFEWLLGFHMHFGLVAVDRKTFARTPKPSLAHLGRIARKNQLV